MASSGQQRVTDRDKGYKRIKEQLEDLDGGAVTVGFHEGDVDSEQVQIASVHEFGAPDANIPERPFMRSTVRSEEKTYGRLGKSLLRNVVDGNLSLHAALGLMGERVRADVQNKIRDLKRPPLKPATIEQKKQGADVADDEPIESDGEGGDTGNPLVDTGDMRQSVNYEVNL